MTAKPTPGSRWKSAVCDTEAVIVRPPSSGEGPSCGGAPMLPITEEKLAGGVPASGFDTGSQLGKRYADETTGLEMLCTKPGAGTLGIAGRALAIKEAKKLPSSD